MPAISRSVFTWNTMPIPSRFGNANFSAKFSAGLLDAPQVLRLPLQAPDRRPNVRDIRANLTPTDWVTVWHEEKKTAR
jgi:hypothetical protein